MILDSMGDFVWFKGGYNQVYNLMAQDYRGDRYLTFWAGDDAVLGHGAGYYYMVDPPIPASELGEPPAFVPEVF
jgi:hypothetical protein